MTNAEFGKASRLLNARDFKNVFDHARLKVSSPELLFLAVPNHLPHARLGLVIAKKNVRLAVQRNRVKRIIRESFRQQQVVTGLDIVVLARRGLDTLDNPQLHDSCNQLWKQLQRRVEKQARRQQQEQEAKSCE
ncbi:ribonuclease P protein component [Litorivivens lipolytica]|uniref:ribonuclease P protein component n=1 Tax=Litorivivens lipolytica TaxID=1524264 RepID=UPI00161011CA